MKQLTDRILAAFERGTDEKKRYYLGCSSLGVECERQAWYQYRHIVSPEGFSARMLKLFDHGHKEEARHAAAVRRAGLPLIGTQHAVSAFGNILRGHTDGFLYIDHALVKDVEVKDEWLLWEMKTSSGKYFRDMSAPLTKEGKPRVHGVQIKKPTHYAQMQLYMGLTDYDVHRALYMMTCKDTDALYCEVVDFDEAVFTSLMERALRVIDGEMPERPYKNPEHYMCRFCDSASICWGEEAPPIQCGSCINWMRGICGLSGISVNQDNHCKDFEMRPALDQNRKDFIFWT